VTSITVGINGSSQCPSKIHQGVAAVYRFVGTSALAAETPEPRHRNRTPTQVIEALAAHLQASTTARSLP
jgi:hypothetical protein